MRIPIFIFVVVLFFAPNANSQTRQQTLEKFENLKQQAKMLEKDIIALDKSDIVAASEENAAAFRILPRDKYDNSIFETHGGYAYYSFYFRSPDYGHGSDIELGGNQFSVGFAGANFGFLLDLGDIPLVSVNKETKGMSFLTSFNPPDNEPKAREEQHRVGSYTGFDIDGVNYKDRVPAIVGHTYAVRSINYDYSDVLVVFKVYRKDTDGSLIIFWKLIEQFDTPSLRATGKPQPTDEEILKRTKDFIGVRLFPEAQAEVNDGVVTLRGTVPKDKLAYIIQLSNSAGARKVINLLNIK